MRLIIYSIFTVSLIVFPVLLTIEKWPAFAGLWLITFLIFLGPFIDFILELHELVWNKISNTKKPRIRGQ